MASEELKTIIESAFAYETAPSSDTSDEAILSDMANARRLAIANYGALVYVPELGKYLHRTKNSHWRHNAGIEYVLAKKSARDRLKEASKYDDPKMQGPVSKFAIRSQSKTLIESCLKLAQTEQELAVSIDKFDAEPWCLPVQNGVINLQTGDFRGIADGDYFLNVSPVTFDAGGECPNWISFLEKVL